MSGIEMKEQLTKREYFAALAMQGLVSKDWPHDEIAEEAMALADDLINALEQEPGVLWKIDEGPVREIGNIKVGESIIEEVHFGHKS